MVAKLATRKTSTKIIQLNINVPGEVVIALLSISQVGMFWLDTEYALSALDRRFYFLIGPCTPK